MASHVLTDVPDHLISTPANITATMKWRATYNVAAWFRFSNIDSASLSVSLKWRDQAGLHETTIDRSTIKGATLLMSGVANLALTGELIAISIVVTTTNHSYIVDELFVQPVNPEVIARKTL